MYLTGIGSSWQVLLSSDQLNYLNYFLARLFQLLAAEHLNAFLAILILTYGKIKINYAFHFL